MEIFVYRVNIREVFSISCIYIEKELALIFAPDSIIVEDMGNISKWKESLAERTVSRQTTNLMQLVYGNSTSIKVSLGQKEKGTRFVLDSISYMSYTFC